MSRPIAPAFVYQGEVHRIGLSNPLKRISLRMSRIQTFTQTRMPTL